MILKVSDAVNLALHAMLLLAQRRNGGRLSVAEMSGRLGVSENHLAKVMQRLAKVGLARSRRGPGGGFTIGRPPGRITLLEIYTAMDGPLSERTCLLDRPVCEGDCCLLGGLLVDLHGRIAEHLERTTLDRICGGPTGEAPVRPPGG